MKKFLLLLAWLLIDISLDAQQPFPLEFVNYSTKWQHLILNEAGIGLGQTESIYTSMDVAGLVDVDSFLYVFYRTKKQSLNNGVIIKKINPKTGKIVWQKTDNIYTGNTHNHSYWSMLIEDNDELLLLGWRAKDISKAFSPNMSIKRYDARTGDVIDYKVDTSDYKYSFFSNQKFYNIGKDSLYFGGTPVIDTVYQNPKCGIQFYTFSKQLIRDSISQFIYNQPLVTDTFTRDYIPVNPRYEVINDHLLYVITFYLSEKGEEYETRSEIIIVDYTDIKNLKVVNRIQIGAEIFDWPSEEFYYWQYAFAEEVQLTWRYPKIDVNDGKLYRACSFLALDTAGNVVARVDDIAQNNHWIYNLKCAGKLQDNYYLLGHRSDDRASFDIMEVDAESRVKLLVSVVTADRPSNDGFNGFNTVQKITKDSLFIFSGALFTKGGEVVPSTTSTHYTMAFDLRQWMRPTASKEVIKDLTIKLYPNPSHDYLNIEVPDIKGKLHFYSSTGALLKTISINGSQSLLVDSSVFPVGVNVIAIEPAEKGGAVRSVKFIKM
ncbi:MAG: T9SS type A sorting domain-containing protein [Saprospiraceae bacterium]|nr:T9SS type A sorting domain-containing protein [Saprospiraceae bacterium]